MLSSRRSAPSSTAPACSTCRSGKELPEGTLLRHISMGDFLVVWDPHWGGGPAKKYYLPQPLPQRRGRGRPPGPPGLPTKTGKAEWDVSQLQAHRVQLVLDLTERRKGERLGCMGISVLWLACLAWCGGV